TNPVYAGRIRHRGQIHEGQHEPIIEPATWQAVQDRLTKGSSKQRGCTSTAGCPSPLAGKLVDETGDRLTPSHANKQGRRYRYYVSSRLIRGGTERASDGWRLPAPALEDRIARAISAPLGKLGPAGLASGLSAEGYERLARAMGEASADPLALPREARLAPGSIEITLGAETLADRLDLEATDISAPACGFTRPFQQRRRGVENKLILGGAASTPDPILIRHIATARRWLELIKAGRSFEGIVTMDEIPKRRVQQLFGLAFLAPDIVRAILDGQQPEGLTTDRLTRQPLPLDWQAQRAIVASLQHTA
ncbi:MAG: recombinase family protein, partial [Pseudomonadota bacterium]